MNKVLDALEREIQIDDKVIYCIEGKWSAGIVEDILEKTHKDNEGIDVKANHVELRKVSFPSDEFKIFRASIMCPSKLIIVPNFNFLTKEFAKSLDTLLKN